MMIKNTKSNKHNSNSGKHKNTHNNSITLENKEETSPLERTALEGPRGHAAPAPRAARRLGAGSMPETAYQLECL